MLMWPQRPDSRVDDLDPGLLAGQVADVPVVPREPSRCSCPTAVRTTLPSTSRLMHVLSLWLPPPIRKLMNGRSIVNAGEVSLPCGVVAAEERVHQPLALEAADRPAGRRACRGRARRRTPRLRRSSRRSRRPRNRPARSAGARPWAARPAWPSRATIVMPSRLHDAVARGRRDISSALSRQTPFSSQPASVTSTGRLRRVLHA